jgi:hypothetical protein
MVRVHHLAYKTSRIVALKAPKRLKIWGGENVEGENKETESINPFTIY